MPELPEVETVRRALATALGTRAAIAAIELRRADLRRAIPRDLSTRFAGATIVRLARRAKYLLFETSQGTLVSHLGMTGTWRLAPAGDERDHDHCYLHLADGRRLAFRDPRRFGLLDAYAPDEAYAPFAALGPEPLDPRAFDAARLLAACQGRRVAIKAHLMNQRTVVGVGNIYAQEALWRARIIPSLPAGRLARVRAAALVAAVRSVLTEAIEAGGSTISDFARPGGEDGYFQHRFAVYDKGGEPCARCGARLRSGVIAGRGTAWCPRCQR